MTYLFDTDHFSILLHSGSVEFVTLSAKMAAFPVHEFGVSIISLHEQCLGANAYLSRAKTSLDVVAGYQLLEEIRSQYSKWQVVPFDQSAADVFDDLHSRKLRVSTMDLRIAAVALSKTLTVLTRNARDFGRVPGLTNEDWTR